MCVYGRGDGDSRLMGKTGRRGRPRLLDELVGSLVGFVDANFVHFRLEDRKAQREKKFAPQTFSVFLEPDMVSKTCRDDEDCSTWVNAKDEKFLAKQNRWDVAGVGFCLCLFVYIKTPQGTFKLNTIACVQSKQMPCGAVVK